MTTAQILVLLAYYVALTALVAFAAHRAWLALAAARARAVLPPSSHPVPAGRDDLPRVCVQLPLYNERTVARRVIAAAAGLDWPRDRLEVQVLDDSTDETRVEVDEAAAAARSTGVDVRVVRRAERAGFKAGALQEGLARTDAELVAIFDADFVPRSDFLTRTVPWLAAPDVGLVQARWAHLNAGASALTRAQAALLDGHFAVEQPARADRGAFFNFNGTAGVWRRAAIEEAGGWRADTLTEDLDLSYRAQLRGWRFVYLGGVDAPAELPDEIGAFRSQQHRWAKGGVECLLRLAGSIVRAPIARPVRREALAHLASNLAYPLLVVVAALLPLAVLIRLRDQGAVLDVLDAVLLAVGAGSLAFYHTVAGARSGLGPARGLARMPLAVVVDTGISLQKALAVFEALAGRRSAFVRTPKRGDARAPRYRSAVAQVGPGELLLAAWSAWGIAEASAGGWRTAGALPFLLLFAVGFGYVGARGAAAPPRAGRAARR